MQVFHHFKHLHTFYFYGIRLYRAFRGTFTRRTRPCIFLLVFCGALGLVQVVNAEWTDSDAQKLVEILSRLETIKQSVDNVPNPNNLLSDISQAVNGQQSNIGVGRLINVEEDFHHTLLTRFGFTGSGLDLSGRLLAMQNILSSIDSRNESIVNILGYTGTQKLKTDMSTIVTKLEAIRTALSSGSGGGGLSSQELEAALRKQFGTIFNNSSVSVNYWRASGSDLVSNSRNVVGFPSIFSLLNEQLVEVSNREMKFLQSMFAVIEQYIRDVPSDFDSVIKLLEDIKSNTSGGSSSSGGGGLSAEELDSALSKYFGSPSLSFITPSQTVNPILGESFSTIKMNYNNKPESLLESLRLLNQIIFYSGAFNLENQKSMTKVYWKGLIGDLSESSSSDLVRDGFVSYSFGDSSAFYEGGKPWRQYTESKFPSPSSVLEALALINMNLARFSNVQSKNMYALGDQNYWSTTNIVARIDPGAYWGNPENDLTTLETNKTFTVSVNTGKGSSSPSSEADYAPVITNDLSVVQIQIDENTNRVYNVKAEEIQARYLRNPFGQPSSSSQIGDVSAGTSEVLEIGGVTLDFGESYALFKEKFLSIVAPKVKKGFGFLWVFLAVLYASIAIRKCVTGGV